MDTENTGKLSGYSCSASMNAIVASEKLNYNAGMDTRSFSLTYYQQPIVSCDKMSRLNKLDERPSGLNSMVALVSNPGHVGMMSAIVINKSSIDRAFGHCFMYECHDCTVAKSTISRNHDKISPVPPLDQLNNNIDHQKYACLCSDGIVGTGERVQKGQVLVNKYSIPSEQMGAMKRIRPGPVSANSYQENALIYKGVTPAVTDQVIITSNELDDRLVKVILRQEKLLGVGDELCRRHGEGSSIVSIVDQVDMPFDGNGTSADLIINPFSLSAVELNAHLVELVNGRSSITRKPLVARSLSANQEDCSVDTESILNNAGFCFESNAIMVDGETGETLETKIYSGPIYYQRVKNLLLDRYSTDGYTHVDVMPSTLCARERKSLTRCGANCILTEY